MQSDLVYHYTSVRSQKRWKSFKESLDSRYLSQVSGGNKLLIIGGSSGSCLSTSFLQKFNEVVVYDKDPVAPLLFKWFHGSKIHKKYFIEDAFSFDGIKLDAKRTAQILKQQRPDFVLFSNVIGQLPIYYRSFFKTSNYVRWASELQNELSPYVWMSFHDIFSIQKTHLKMPDYIDLAPSDTIVTLSEKYKLPQALFDHLVLEQKWPHFDKCLKWDLHSNAIHYVGVASNLRK